VQAFDTPLNETIIYSIGTQKCQICSLEFLDRKIANKKIGLLVGRESRERMLYI